MKKLKVLALALSLSLLCTGCGTTGIQLTEAENDIIAEYIAGILLKHDFNYDEKLIYDFEDDSDETIEEEADTEEPVKEETETEATKKETSDDIQPEEPVEQNASWEDIFTDSEVKISFSKANTCQNYPGKKTGSYFLLEAGENHQLIAVMFSIKNTSDKEKKVSLIQSGITYCLLDANGKENKPLLTALPDDMQYLDITIKSKQKDKGVVLFEVPKGTKVDDYTLVLSKGDKVMKIPCK